MLSLVKRSLVFPFPLLLLDNERGSWHPVYTANDSLGAYFQGQIPCKEGKLLKKVTDDECLSFLPLKKLTKKKRLSFHRKHGVSPYNPDYIDSADSSGKRLIAQNSSLSPHATGGPTLTGLVLKRTHFTVSSQLHGTRRRALLAAAEGVPREEPGGTERRRKGAQSAG